jgi:hypothetical protein
LPQQIVLERLFGDALLLHRLGEPFVVELVFLLDPVERRLDLLLIDRQLRRDRRSTARRGSLVEHLDRQLCKPAPTLVDVGDPHASMRSGACAGRARDQDDRRDPSAMTRRTASRVSPARPASDSAALFPQARSS